MKKSTLKNMLKEYQGPEDQFLFFLEEFIKSLPDDQENTTFKDFILFLVIKKDITNTGPLFDENNPAKRIFDSFAMRFTVLPIELQDKCLVEYADVKTMAVLSRSSTTFFNSLANHWQNQLRELPLNSDVLDALFERKIIRSYQHLYSVLSKNVVNLKLSSDTEEWVLLLASGEVPAVQRAIQSGGIPSITYSESLIPAEGSEEDKMEVDESVAANETAKAKKLLHAKLRADEKKINKALQCVLLSGKKPGVQCLVEHINFSNRNPRFNICNYADFMTQFQFACASGNLETIEYFCMAGQVNLHENKKLLAYGQHRVNLDSAGNYLWSDVIIHYNGYRDLCSPYLRSLCLSGNLVLLQNFYSIMLSLDKEFGEQRAGAFLQAGTLEKAIVAAVESGSIPMLEYLIKCNNSTFDLSTHLGTAGTNHQLKMMLHVENTLLEQKIIFENPGSNEEALSNAKIYAIAIKKLIPIAFKQGIEYAFNKMIANLNRLPGDLQKSFLNKQEFLCIITNISGDPDGILNLFISKLKLQATCDDFITAMSAENKRCMRLLKTHLESNNKFDIDEIMHGDNLLQLLKSTYKSESQFADMIIFMRSLGFSSTYRSVEGMDSFQSLENYKENFSDRGFDLIKEALSVAIPSQEEKREEKSTMSP